MFKLKWEGKLSELVRANKFKTTEEILQPVNHVTFDSDSDDISDISESDLRPGQSKTINIKGPNSKRYKRKYKEDTKLVSLFTDDFKQTIREVRSESKINASLTKETLDDLRKIMSMPKVIKCDRDTTSIILEPNRINIPPQAAESKEDSASSVESNFWMLLAANCDAENFHVSEPGYDSRFDETSHWLDRPPVPWEVIDKSIVKCRKWLSE